MAIWSDSATRTGICFDYDVGAVDQIKALPAHRRRWDSHLKVWWLWRQAEAERLAEIAAAYLDVKVVWYMARPDWLQDRAHWIENRGWETGRSGRGRKEEPVHAGTSAGPSGAYGVLHLQPTAPPELVKAAYRVMARTHHPDAGGSEEAMKRINAAYESLTK